jgi:hypothetical protein
VPWERLRDASLGTLGNARDHRALNARDHRALVVEVAGEERHEMDEDLAGMSREQLIAEVRKLRRGVRTHRDASGHELCWHHPALWGLLPEKQDPIPIVPEWPEFIRGCVRYRQSLDEQAPDAPRSSRPYDR